MALPMVVALMGLAPLSGGGSEKRILHRSGRSSRAAFGRERVALRTEKFSEKFNVTNQHDQSDRDKHENERSVMINIAAFICCFAFSAAAFSLSSGFHSGILTQFRERESGSARFEPGSISVRQVSSIPSRDR